MHLKTTSDVREKSILREHNLKTRYQLDMAKDLCWWLKRTTYGIPEKHYSLEIKHYSTNLSEVHFNQPIFFQSEIRGGTHKRKSSKPQTPLSISVNNHNRQSQRLR